MIKIIKKLKKLPLGFKAALVYTIASVFSKGLSIITVPVFTRIMSTDEIGVVNLYNSLHSILAAVVTLSLTSGGYIVALKDFENDRDRYQSSVLSLTTLLALIVSVVYFICPQFWNELLGLPTELMILMLAGFLLAPAYDFWLARQRYEYHYKLAGSLTILMALIASAAAIFVVLKINNDGGSGVAQGRLFASNIISYILYGILWVYIIFKGRLCFSKKYWTYSLKLSIPLVGYALASQVLSVSDRMMISKMVDNSAVGIYSTLYTVSSISLIVWSAINASFVPYLYQNIDKPENNIKKYSLQLMGSYAIVAALMTFLAPEIVGFLATEEYFEAIYIMPPIAAGVFLTCVSNMYTNILIYYKKTHYIMYASIVAAVANVILNYFFISQFGYMAAAYTTLAAYIILAFGQGICAKLVCKKERKDAPDVYNDKAVGIMALLVILVTLSGLIWYQYTIIRYSIIVLGTIFGIIYGLKVYKARKSSK